MSIIAKKVAQIIAKRSHQRQAPEISQEEGIGESKMFLKGTAKSCASFGRKKAQFGEFSVQTPAKRFFDDMPALIQQGLRPDSGSFADVHIDFKWDTVETVCGKEIIFAQLSC